MQCYVLISHSKKPNKLVEIDGLVNIIQLYRLETGKRLDNLSVDDEIDKLKNHFVKWRYGYS